MILNFLKRLNQSSRSTLMAFDSIFEIVACEDSTIPANSDCNRPLNFRVAQNISGAN
jgi:hypothetical protein